MQAREHFAAATMKRFLRSRVFKLLVCAGLAGGIVAAGIVEPRGPAGPVVFHSAHAFPPTRPAVLRCYTWSLREFEGGYLPPGIDAFLIDRLDSCGGEPEEDAILGFQLRQGAGRWGGAASRSHETRQKQIIAHILSRLDAMGDPDAVSAMLFIESMRRRDPLGKGGFVGIRNLSQSPAALDRRAFEAAKEGFRKGWGDGSGWPRIRADDPLAGTGLALRSGP